MFVERYFVLLPGSVAGSLPICATHQTLNGADLSSVIRNGALRLLCVVGDGDVTRSRSRRGSGKWAPGVLGVGWQDRCLWFDRRRTWALPGDNLNHATYGGPLGLVVVWKLLPV
jgi:hypothetical protein